jgi:hypothetical protein
LSYNWNVYKIFNNGKRAKAPMHTFTYADEDKVQQYFDTVIKENFEEKIRRWDFTLIRADQPQERKAEVVDEEAKLLERNQNRVFGRLLQSAHLPPVGCSARRHLYVPSRTLSHFQKSYSG